MKPIKVTQPDEVPIEIMAKAIVGISDGIKRLIDGPLNEKALILLIQNCSPMVGGKYGKQKIGTAEIKGVLEGISRLKEAYLKKTTTNTKGTNP